MANIAIVVEDEPAPALLAEMEIEPPDTLLGLYQGTPLTERRWDYGNTLPDRILIFQGPHEREAAEDAGDNDEDDLVMAIGETLIHEVGHYFGMSEEQIEEIEEKYWRGGGSGSPPPSGLGRNFSSPAGARKWVAQTIPPPPQSFWKTGPA